MAGTDHGEVLTHFEELFGSVVEHEVIKLILQSCEWDAATASDTLLGMIDKNNLPPHVLSALNADSIVRGLARRHPASPEPSEKQDMGPQASNYPINGTQGTLEANSRHVHLSGNVINAKNRSPPMSTIPDSTSEKPVITVPPSACAFPHASPSTPHHVRAEERGGAGSPLSTSTTKSGESVSSSPSFSPLRFKSVAEAGTLESNASQWVLAPQFVPNAFNLKSSDVGNKSGVWLQGMSSRLMAALPSTNAPPPKHDVKGDKLCKKEEIINKILYGTKIMVLMRGLPGSGKSTLAKELKGANGIVLSTDDFFYDKHGKYNYDSSKIGEAHQWNKHRASQKLKQGRTPIIVDNTNLQRWEMKPYVKLALQYGYDVDLLDTDTPWRLSPKELGRKNSHGVPTKKIEEMKERYELNVKIEDMVADLQGIELTQLSPSKNSASIVHEVITLENDLKGTDITKCGPSKTLKKSYAANQNGGSTALDNECSVFHHSAEGEFDFESDEDVVVEGYDEEDNLDLTEMHLCTADDKIQVIQSNQSITESGHDTKETTSCGHEQLDSMNMSDETENEIHDKENISSENLDSPIDLTHALMACSTKEEEREGQEILDYSKKMGDESYIYTCELENGPDTYDEAKIQSLLDEASKSIDINRNEEEWDNLVLHISGDDFSDEKFNDLVTSFGSALKKQIESKGSKGISDAKDDCVASESVSEDLAMYDLISTVEDNTGQSVSALVTKLAKNDGATDMPLIEKTGEEKACNPVPSSIEPEMEDLSRNLSGLKLRENSPEIPSVGSEECYKALYNDLEPITEEPLPQGKCKEKEEDKGDHSKILNTEDAERSVADEVGGLFSQDNTDLQMGSDSLVSWECVDVNSEVSSVTWDSKSDNPNSDRDVRLPKPCRTQRNRIPGNPSKWLNESGVQNESIDEPIASWVAVESGTPQWDSSEPARILPEASPLKSGGASSKYLEVEEPQSHTGAVSKFRKHKRRSESLSPNSRRSSKSGVVPVVTAYQEQPKTSFKEVETQTLSIDFEALQLDHNLYELKVLFGKPHYVPVTTNSCSFSEKGPLTKGGLKLEKGTMTDNMYENSVSSFQNLVAFFPNIPKEDLQDVFEKCRFDSDWAMNVLLDSGYEMSDPNDVTVQEVEVDIETDSVSEITNTDEGKNDQSSCDTSDVAFDNFADERTRKIRQSQQPDDLAKKLEIEKSFVFPESVDDRVLRLTGKQYSDLNMTKVKKSKSRKQHGKGNNPPANTRAEEVVDGEGEGAQYVTLVMDPLFASQLNMMFGPVGDYEISGDLTFEDRSVVLPLEICEMIHKYWARTVNGKFKHEAEILDSLVRQDEILARKLQEEENAAFNLSGKGDDVTDDGLLEDKPLCFQEIMDLEQALQESLADKSTPEDTSISSILNLKRLYKEYPHVDPVALKEEYTRNGFKYHITVQKLNQRFGKEQGIPKTVIAPEALSRYEQEMIERAQQDSLVEEEVEVPSNQHDEIVPDDPQVFRDEAQAHYHQRQEAFQKAQEASRRGMKAAAAYYAYIGNLHSEKLREANQRASQKILEAQNAHRKDANCLDLHLLHVPEARSATQAFLHERQRVLIARGIRQMEVTLITGRGAHSVGGQAVLKPAIKEHLKKNGYSFCEANSGMLKVILRGKPS